MSAHIEEGKTALPEHFENSVVGQNGSRQIGNILQAHTQEELFADVDDFVNKYQLDDHKVTFRKGALVAQSPTGYDSIPGLTESDKQSLRYEADHKWKLPFRLYFAGECVGRARGGVLMLALQLPSVRLALPLKAGIRRDRTVQVSRKNGTGRELADTYGIDLTFPKEFGIDIPIGSPGGGRAEWTVGFVNSAPYISAALIGVWRTLLPPPEVIYTQY